MRSILSHIRHTEMPFTSFKLDIVKKLEGLKTFPKYEPRGLQNAYSTFSVSTTEKDMLSTLKIFRKTPFLVYKNSRKKSLHPYQ